MKRINIADYAIVADFDGTITLQDSNDLLCLTHGNAENVQIEADFCAGIRNGSETMRRHFQAMRIGFDTYFDFLDAHIQIDPGFDVFLQHLRTRDMPFFIVSGGYRQGILRILGEERSKGIQIFANDLLEKEGYLSPQSATEATACTEAIGPCDNCKKVCLATIRRQSNKKILFIGDGMTDRCAGQEADLLFAKRGYALEKHCQGRELPYIPYTDFNELTAYLWKNDKTI